MFCWMVWILGRSWDPSFTVTEQAMTALETPQALPSATTRTLKILQFHFQATVVTQAFWLLRGKKLDEENNFLKNPKNNSIPCFDLTNT